MVGVAVTLPRLFTPPLRDLSEPDASWGHDFVWFCREHLRDPLSDWQEWLAIHALEVLTVEKATEFAMIEDDPTAELAKVERLYGPPVVKGGRPIPNGRLRFTKIVILISRQNGKTDFVKKLIKWGLFRKRMSEIMAAAQTLNKAMDLWNEILLELQQDPRMASKMDRPKLLNGSQAIWTKGKRGRYRPVGIDENAGRGDTVDLLYIDELRTQKDYTGVNALEATTTVPDNGLLVTTSNAGSAHSVVLKEYRDLAKRPIDEGRWADTRQGLFEWSADPKLDIDDEGGWKQANPDLGNGRITLSTLRAVRESSSEASFRTERLCQWVEELEGDEFVPIVDLDRWGALAVSRPVRVGECVLAVEVSPDGESVSLVSAGQTVRGAHIQVCPQPGEFTVDGTAAAIRRFVDEYQPASVLLDKDSPAAVLVPALLRLGIEPVQIGGGQVSASLRSFEQSVGDWKVTHDGHGSWLEALQVAEKRGEGTKFPSIERFSGDVSVLVAATFAVWGLDRYLSESGVEFKQVEEKKMNPPGLFPTFSTRPMMGGDRVG